MHVPDGFLSPQITLPAYAISARNARDISDAMRSRGF